MAWFKVDDGFANSRPVLAIPRRYRAQAVGLWVMAGTWSAKELTDGFVPRYVVNEVAASTPAIATYLVKAGLWEVCSDRDGFLFVGWAKYQFTKEQVLTRRKSEAEKKQRARDAARKADEQRRNNTVPEGVPRGQVGESLGESLGESGLPDQTRPDQTRTNLSLVTSKGGVALVDAPEPPRQCQSHINDPTPPRCGFCSDARKLHAEWTSQRNLKRDREKSEHRSAIDACALCDENGMTEVGNGLDRCSHQAVSSA